MSFRRQAPPEPDTANWFSAFDESLQAIENRIQTHGDDELPLLFQRIPLDVFGTLLLGVPERFPNLKAILPRMAPDEVQDNWTGSHGNTLLQQSLAFVKTLVYGYASLTGNRLGNARVLDYGCGWGRILRLLIKLVPSGNLHGVDPWDQSIALCKEHGVKGQLALSQYLPRSLPLEGKFDLIFAFSVFTHLSRTATRINLETLRQYISDSGILVITIRPKEYWNIHQKGVHRLVMTTAHDSTGFAFMPHIREPIEGDVTYGDTSMTLEYFEANFPAWKIRSVECNAADPYQVILFLEPN